MAEADPTKSAKADTAAAEDRKKPEKPDEEAFRAEVAQAEKEHAALMERLVGLEGVSYWPVVKMVVRHVLFSDGWMGWDGTGLAMWTLVDRVRFRTTSSRKSIWQSPRPRAHRPSNDNKNCVPS